MSLLGNIGGILSGVGALAGAGAAIFAGNKQAKAADNAAANTAAQAAQAREDFAPWRGQGVVGLYSLADLMGQARPLNAPTDESLGALSGAELGFQGFEGSPGYQFRLKEGQKAVDNAFAARGMLRSGGRAKALTRFGQGLASDEFNNEFARRAALAGIGQAATSQDANLQAQLTAQANQAGLDAATARGSSFVGATNALNGGINQFLLARAFGG